MLVCVVLGCGCRTDIDLPPDDETEPEEEEELPDCTPDLTPRVEDCARPAAPDAVPIAKVFRPSRFMTDDEFLYYASDRRAFRLSMSGGEPEPLTPPDSVRGTFKHLAGGFLYWKNEWVDDGTVLRVPTTGGEPEPVVELVPDALWAPVGQDVIWGASSEPSPVYRTSSISGETTEILAADAEDELENINVAAGHALATFAHSLVAIPLDGGEPRVLVAEVTMSGTNRPLVHDGLVYFGATILMTKGELSPELGPAIWRVDLEEPSTPELVLSGFPIAFTFDDALYAHIIPENPSGGSATGRIVRAPLSGGDAVEITGTSSRALGTGAGFGPYEIGSSALVVSGCNVYFAETCSIDPPTNDFRLVTMSKVP